MSVCVLQHRLRDRHLRLALVLSAALALAGCVSSSPKTGQGSVFKSRAMAQEKGGVRASVVALSAAESEAVYGVPLAGKGMQPVWIEIDNRDDRAYWLMYPGLDPNFFPVSEAVEAFEQDGSGAGAAELARRFRVLAFRNPVSPGATKAGFVLTNLDEGVKLVQLDLLATGRLRAFSFLTVVPGFRADYHAREVFSREIYPPEEIVDYTEDDAFRAALETLPCCVTNESGSKNGDPLNLVVVGGVQDAFPALVRRGWRPTEVTWSGSVWKMVASALAGERYAYAPVSNLYLYGRPQDLALQKARDNIHQRNHLRLWLSPMRYKGKHVWVGQISRDIGSRLTIHSPTLTTHKIDPHVDEARTALLEDLAYSQSLAEFGYVAGVGAAAKTAPRRNLTTDPYYTDGLRVVLVFEQRPASLEEIELLPWEQPRGGLVEQSVQRKQK